MTCTKAPYRSRNGALLVLAKILATGNSQRRERAVYRCHECLRWHLTTKRPVKWGIRGSHVDFA